MRARRRVTAGVLGLVAAIVVTAFAPQAAGAATPGTTVRCAGPSTTEGTDVSANQGSVNWTSVKASGREWAYAKALDGIGNLDANFVGNYQGIKAAGMQAGAYLFYRAWVDPVTQAHVFVDRLQAAGYAPGDLVPVIDAEKDTSSTSPPVSTATYIDNLRTVEALIEAAIGTPPVIYTGPDFWAVELGNPTGFAANPLWIANYGNACPEVPNSWSNWTMWQYSKSGTVAGISTPADLDRSNGAVLPSAPSVAPAFFAEGRKPPSPASVGTPYTFRFRASGVPTPTYSVASGALPPGVTLDATTGMLSGEPTTPGSYTFDVRASNGIGPGVLSSPTEPLSIQVAPPAAGFHSMVPYRVLDSRFGNGWNGKVSAGAPRELVVTGASGVPATASAVVMNVTVADSTDASFLTAYPKGVGLPNASNLNFGAGQIIANLVTVRIGTGGVVQFANAVGETNVVADIVGYYDDGSPGGELFNGIAPDRVLDSRTSIGGWAGTIGKGQTRTLQVTGGTVPAGATSVVMNVTVTEGTAQSYLQVWPADAAKPTSSNVNSLPGQTIPNLVTVKLSATGAVSIFNSEGASHVIADVLGYYGATGSRFHSLPAPTRIVDSRYAVGHAGRIWADRPPVAITVTGRNGIPTGATGLVTNVTVADSDTESFLTVFPGDLATAPALGSNLNFGRNQVIPNLVLVKLPAAGPGAGQLKVFNAAGLTQVIFDAVGYFAP